MTRRFYIYEKKVKEGPVGKKIVNRSYRELHPEQSEFKNRILPADEYLKLERKIGTKAMKIMGIKREGKCPSE